MKYALIVFIILGVVFKSEAGDLAIGPALSAKEDNRVNNGEATGEFILVPFPFISYTDENFFIQGNFGVWRLTHSKMFTFGPMLSISDPVYSTDGIDERKRGIWGGMHFRLAFFMIEWQWDLVGFSRGMKLNANLVYPVKFSDKFTTVVQLGQFFFDKNFVRYYYNVSAEESLDSGLPVYNGDDSHRAFFRLYNIYSFMDPWQLRFLIQYNIEGSDISDSPTVSEKDRFGYLLALLYKF